MPLKTLAKFFTGPSPHLPREEAIKVFERDHYKCYYCGLDGLHDLENWMILTIDHIHPHAKGGSRNLANLVTACQPCNLLKGKRVYKSLQDAKEHVIAKREEWRKVFDSQVKAAS
jgi:5-methylcytosine-specific restriction endonuclease McrA